MAEEKEALKDAGLELTKPLIDELSSKLKLPFIGGFVFSWCIINWERVAILLTSKENIYTRIEKIKQIKELDWPIIGDWHTSTFFAPLLYSMVITAITPFLTLGFKKLQKWANVRIIDTQAELNHRYQVSSAVEVLKLETTNKKISDVKFSTESLEKKHNELEQAYNSSVGKLENIKAKIKSSIEEHESIKAEIQISQSELEGYRDSNDKIKSIEKINEHFKQNLIKANGVIDNYEIINSELTEAGNTLRRDLNTSNNNLTEALENVEIYKNETLSTIKFMNELLEEGDIVIFQLKNMATYDEKALGLLNQLETWQEIIKRKLTQLNHVTSI